MRIKNFLSNVFLIFLSIIVTAILLEVGLRFSGKALWYFISNINEYENAKYHLPTTKEMTIN